MHTHPEKIFFFNAREDGLGRYLQKREDRHHVTGHMHLWTDTAYHILDTPHYDCRADGIEIMQRRIVDHQDENIVTLDKLYKFDQKNPWQTQSASLTTMTDIQPHMSVNDINYFNIGLQYMTPMTVTRYDVAFRDTLVQATQWHVPSLQHDMALLTLNPVMAAAADGKTDARLQRLTHLYEMINDMLGNDLIDPMGDMPMQQVARGMCVFKMP